MRKLKKYLIEQRRTIRWLAKECDCSANHISGYINGKLRIHLKTARRINKAIDNALTIEELLAENPDKDTLPKFIRIPPIKVENKEQRNCFNVVAENCKQG